MNYDQQMYFSILCPCQGENYNIAEQQALKNMFHLKLLYPVKIFFPSISDEPSSTGHNMQIDDNSFSLQCQKVSTLLAWFQQQPPYAHRKRYTAGKRCPWSTLLYPLCTCTVLFGWSKMRIRSSAALRPATSSFKIAWQVIANIYYTQLIKCRTYINKVLQ